MVCVSCMVERKMVKMSGNHSSDHIVEPNPLIPRKCFHGTEYLFERLRCVSWGYCLKIELSFTNLKSTLTVLD